MRLFTALDLPPEILLQFEHLLTGLRPEAPINWSPLENLHITTKFIGEWPERRMEQMDKALSELSARAPFPVDIHDLGWFPNETSPKVLWAGIDGGAALTQLASDTEERLSGLSVGREARPYAPHLTLARIKSAVPLQNLRARVKELERMRIGSFVATCFYLFSSDPGSSGSIYRKLREYRFEKAISAQQTK